MTKNVNVLSSGYPLDTGIHDTSAHCPRVHQVSTSGLTVPEKSDTNNFNV